MFGTYPYQYARNRNEVTLAQGHGRVGRELFSTLIIFLSLILAAEFVLATRFYREAK